jgi:hypothetical protein
MPKFSRRFASPVRPQRGPMREIATIGDVAKLIIGLDPGSRSRPHWQRTVELLRGFSEDRKNTIDVLRSQLLRALRSEGWL